MEWPLISIVLPAVDSVATLPLAIESVLKQDYPNIELLVIDDASTDATGELLWEYRLDRRIRYIRNTERRGMLRTMNTGLRKARGEFICVLAAEDKLLPGFVMTAQRFFQSHRHLDIVQTGIYIMDERARLITRRNDPLPFSRATLRNEYAEFLAEPITPAFSSLLVRRSVYDRFGHFDVRGGPCADLEILLRWAQANLHFGYIPLPLAGYRIHSSRLQGTQSSFDDGTLLRDTLRLCFHAFVEENAHRVDGYEHRIAQRLETLYSQTVKSGFIDHQAEARAAVDACLDRLAQLKMLNTQTPEQPSLSIIVLADGTQRDVEKMLSSLLMQDAQAWDALVIHPHRIELKSYCHDHDLHGRITLAALDEMPNDAAAINMGLRAVRGNAVTFLRTGTTLPHRHLQNVLDALEQPGGDVIVSGSLVLVNDTILHAHATTSYPNPLHFDGILVAPTFPLEAITVKRSALDEAGFFNEHLPEFAEWEYLLRLRASHALYVLEHSPIQIRGKIGARNRYSQNPGLARATAEIYSAFPVSDARLSTMRVAYLHELQELYALGPTVTWSSEGLLQLHKQISGQQTFENAFPAMLG